MLADGWWDMGVDRYYMGEAVEPILTIVIAGNHEASSYFWEL